MNSSSHCQQGACSSARPIRTWSCSSVWGLLRCSLASRLRANLILCLCLSCYHFCVDALQTHDCVTLHVFVESALNLVDTAFLAEFRHFRKNFFRPLKILILSHPSRLPSFLSSARRGRANVTPTYDRHRFVVGFGIGCVVVAASGCVRKQSCSQRQILLNESSCKIVIFRVLRSLPSRWFLPCKL